MTRSMRARVTAARMGDSGRLIACSGGEVGGGHDGAGRALEAARRDTEADAMERRHEDDVAVGGRVHPHARRCPPACRTSRCPRRCSRRRANSRGGGGCACRSSRWASCVRSSRASACRSNAREPHRAAPRCRPARPGRARGGCHSGAREPGSPSCCCRRSRVAAWPTAGTHSQRDQQEQGALKDLSHTTCIESLSRSAAIRAFQPIASSLSRMPTRGRYKARSQAVER